MGAINAKIFSLKDGYEALGDLKSIRIKSKTYNLLVMEDYLPIIGEIDGSITFVGEDSERTYEDIKAFYRHSHNEFELLVKSRNND